MASPQSSANPVRLRFDEFELDEANASFLRDGKAVALAPTPFSLLCALARQPGALLTKDALLDSVWGHQFVSESVLKTAISDIRVALGDNPREPRFIETVSRRGYRFIAVPAPMTPSTPLRAAAEFSASPSLIGRSGTVARLRAAWDKSVAGQRTIVWVAGEPGIGKTMVIEHFVTGLGAIVCARGQCVDHYGSGEPYLPVLEALAELCRKDPALPELMRSVAPTWLLQLPWLGNVDERDALRRELAGVGPDRMLREMGELLDRYTEQRPLLLVTEDLHWSDRATIQLIDHVARRRGRACLMWLASFRVAEVIAQDHPLNALRRELRPHRLCEELLLEPFSEAEVGEYVAQLAPSLAGNETFVRALHGRTDGVPLFVSSVIAQATERPDSGAADPAWFAAARVPDNLAAIIDHYIARLGSEQRHVLAVAAVCGTDFRADTVALALGRELASVALAFDELVGEHVWLATRRPADSGGDALELAYSFRHALFRQVLYDRTPPSTRVQLHRDVGAALQRERSTGTAVTASELAMHFDRGRQPMNALRYYTEAANAMLLQFNPAACMEFTKRATVLLPQVPQDAERDALEITLATLHGVAAFHTRGVGDEARRAFERAYVLLPGTPQHPVGGRLLQSFGFLLSMRGEYAASLEVARRAETLSAGSDDPPLMLAACFVHSQTLHLQGRSKASRSWIERGLAIMAVHGNAGNEVFAADPQVTQLGMLAVELVSCGLIEQGRAHVRKARACAHELRQPMTRLVAAWLEALFEVRLGSFDRVEQLAGEMCELVEEFSLPQGRNASAWFRGWALARQGQPREGHRLIREGGDGNVRLGMRAGSSEVLGYAAEALLLAGDLAEARAALQEAQQVVEDLGERVYLPQLLMIDAAIARAEGRPGASAAAARRAIDEAHAQEAHWLELQALVGLCEQGEATGDERLALAGLVGALPEAADTEPVNQARALLAPVRPA